MVDSFPRLNGEVDDMDDLLDGYPPVDHDKHIVLRQDYAEETLKWWETYQTDNGPASETINGLATSGGATTVDLDTGSTSSGDVTTIAGPTVNWDNWTEIRAYLWGLGGGTAADLIQYLSLADDKDISDMAEGFYVDSRSDGLRGRVKTGGTSQNSTIHVPIPRADMDSIGMRLYENENGSGHGIDFVLNGGYADGWNEGSGWANATDLTFYHGVKTFDGTSQVVQADGWLLELIP